MTGLNGQKPELRNYRTDGAVEIVGDPWLTVQGEGPFVGEPAVFVRLAACNLQCPDCDTDYTSDRSFRSVVVLVNDIDEAFRNMVVYNAARLVVLTGGEPFRQEIGPLVRDLLTCGFRVQVETNGTLPPPPEFPLAAGVTIVCSPKGRVHDDLKPHVHHLKYVIEAGRQHPGTKLALNVLGNRGHAEQPWPGFKGTVWVQPADLENAECMKLNTEACVDAALTRGYRVTLQIHKLLGVK